MFDFLSEIFRPPKLHEIIIAAGLGIAFWGIFFYGLFTLISKIL